MGSIGTSGRHFSTEYDYDRTTNEKKTPLSREATVILWLKSLGLTLRQPNDLSRERAMEFSDGTTLCRVVQKCELMRGSIPGVAKDAKNRAQCLNNVRNAFAYLKKRRNMPIDYLYSEELIVDGLVEVIVPLLLQIRKSYGHHLRRKK